VSKQITIVNLKDDVRRETVRPLRYFKMYGQNFMAHRDYYDTDMFVVSEVSTGAYAGKGYSVKEAWRESQRFLIEYGKEKTLAQVAKWINLYGGAN
jgi:hypothetical protein